MPGLTDRGIVSRAYSEHVDLFVTLAEAAAGIVLEPCPRGAASFNVSLCTEGTSLMPIIRGAAASTKEAAFSQYPRKHVKAARFLGKLLDREPGDGATSPCIIPNGEG